VSRREPRKKAQVSRAQVARVDPQVRPSGDDRPRARTFVPADPDGKIIIQFGRVDVGGPWCLSKITPEDHQLLLENIRSFESMTMHEVFSSSGYPGKDYPLENGLPNQEATDRLLTLDCDDMDRISRLQLDGKRRLYGFRRGDRFYALWWDPEHVIWPSTLKHT
jgi:hypothetical protein